MESKRFLTAQDVMEMLGVSLSYSYKLIRRLNAELFGYFHCLPYGEHINPTVFSAFFILLY